MWSTTDPTRQRDTPLHRAWRGRVLTRAGGLCEIRYPNRCTTTATEADHIVELSDGGAPYDINNGQAACTACHAHKTALHANQKRWSQRTSNHPDETHPGLR
jgi:5-methylcytosine-specific restriction endonuclease McrA